MRYALALASLIASHAAAATPAWCSMIDPTSPLYRANCAAVTPAPVPTPPATPGKQGLTCEATASKATVTFAGATCERWDAYRSGSTLVVACAGTPAPAGAAALYCVGSAVQCGR